VYLNGQTVGGLRVAGKRINFTAEEYTLGQMAEATMENILKIKSKALEFISGLTEKSMKGTGKTASSMVRVNLQINRANLE